MAKKWRSGSVKGEVRFVDDTTPVGKHEITLIVLSKRHAMGAMFYLDSGYSVWVPDFDLNLSEWATMFVMVGAGGAYDILLDEAVTAELSYEGGLTFRIIREG